MSDYMWAKIEIGGAISRTTLANLMEKFEVAPPVSGEDGAAPSEASSYLVLEDDEASDGVFQELEDYLVEQAIPFDRTSDGRYEYSPELRRFRPGGGNSGERVLQAAMARTFLCDHGNRPMAALVDIKAALDQTQTREGLAVRLVELCGLDIPDLPPLSIVEATG